MKNQEQQKEPIEVLKLIGAITPSWYNRDFYSNKIKQKERVTVFTEDGTPIETEIEFFISWESIQQVLKLVHQKARLPDDLGIQIQQESN